MHLRIRDVRSHIALLIIAALVLYPLFYMLVNAINTGITTATDPWWVGSVLQWQNYRDALAVVAPAFLRTVAIVVPSDRISVSAVVVKYSPPTVLYIGLLIKAT